MNARPAGRRSAVEKALLDYQRSPGKFALATREPAVLFSSMKDVLQIAAGRAAEGEDADTPSTHLRQAACFFMRGAMLHQTADHYALLGLDKAATTDAVKDHYRLMMRLIHPDFAQQEGGAEWPPDTASRVNRAYETLSSHQLREQYDADMTPPPVFPVAASTAQALRADAEKPAPADPRAHLRMVAGVMGGVGVLLLGTFFFGGSDRESLVQRHQEDAAEAAVETKARVVETVAAPVVRTAPVVAPEPVVAAVTAKPLAPPPAPAETAPQPPPPPTRIANAVLALLPPIVGQLDQARPFVAMIQPAAKPATPATVSPTLKISTAVSSMQSARPTPPVPAPAPVVAAPVIEMPRPAPVAIVEPPPVAAPVPAPVARPNPGVTIAQVHPLLAELVQQVESGTGDRLLTVLDRDARRSPAALALVRQYNSIVDGGTVKVSHVQFRTEPQEGRLLVTGYFIMEVAAPSSSPAGKELILQAEFVSRNGAVVMTGLSRQGAVRAQ